MSKLIVLEGPDRTGKATQAELLRKKLASYNKSAIVIEVPIQDHHIHDLIYWMLQNGIAKKIPKLFQGLQCLNKWIFQTFNLVNLEHVYDYIIFDRWSVSASIYGEAEGVDKEFLDQIYGFLRKPDYTFVLLGDSHKHVTEDVYERDEDLQTKVRLGYYKWAKEYPPERHIIDCTQSKEKINEEIIRSLVGAGLLKVDAYRIW